MHTYIEINKRLLSNCHPWRRRRQQHTVPLCFAIIKSTYESKGLMCVRGNMSYVLHMCARPTPKTKQNTLKTVEYNGGKAPITRKMTPSSLAWNSFACPPPSSPPSLGQSFCYGENHGRRRRERGASPGGRGGTDGRARNPTTRVLSNNPTPP